MEDFFSHINDLILFTLWQEHPAAGHKENPIMLVRVRAVGPHIVLAVQVEPVNSVIFKL